MTATKSIVNLFALFASSSLERSLTNEPELRPITQPFDSELKYFQETFVVES